MSLFSSFWSGLSSIFNKIFSHATVERVQAIGKEIEQYLPAALKAVELVNSIVPTRIESELIALGQKYLLHVTPEILADPVQVETLLQNAALKELQKLFPSAKNSILRDAISFCVHLAKAEKAEPATTDATATA